MLKRFFAGLFVAALSVAPANAAITRATLLGAGHSQAANATNTGTTSANNCAAGSTIILVATGNSNTNVLASVADSASNIWQTPIDVTTNTGTHLGVAYAINTANALNIGGTITASFGSSTTTFIAAECVQGLSATAPLDKHNNTATGTGTSSTGVTTGTLNDTNEIVYGIFGAGSAIGTSACGSGFTSFAVNNGVPSMRACWQIVSSSASVSFVPTWTNSVDWVMDVVTFDTNGGVVVTNHFQSLMGVGQ